MPGVKEFFTSVYKKIEVRKGRNGRGARKLIFEIELDNEIGAGERFDAICPMTGKSYKSECIHTGCPIHPSIFGRGFSPDLRVVYSNQLIHGKFALECKSYKGE